MPTFLRALAVIGVLLGSPAAGIETERPVEPARTPPAAARAPQAPRLDYSLRDAAAEAQAIFSRAEAPVQAAVGLAVPQAAQLKPTVYLAGAWGFSDFKADRPSYGEYARQAATAVNPGLRMLQAIEQKLEAAGWRVLNPWTDTVPSVFIDGVMFGAGRDVWDGAWSEPSLASGDMPVEGLRHWISVLARHPLARPHEHGVSPASTREQLEEAYRGMVGDITYRGNRGHVESSDVVFVDLNAYRGDVDDGTLWEAIWAIERGKKVVALVDERPEASLGEGIFGRRNRWNMMISGYLKEHAGQVAVVHSIDEGLAALGRAKAGL